MPREQQLLHQPPALRAARFLDELSSRREPEEPRCAQPKPLPALVSSASAGPQEAQG